MCTRELPIFTDGHRRIASRPGTKGSQLNGEDVSVKSHPEEEMKRRG